MPRLKFPGSDSGQILSGGQRRKLDRNVQDIAYRPHPGSSSLALQRTSVLTNPFAFFPFSRVLSGGEGFNIGSVSPVWQGACI